MDSRIHSHGRERVIVRAHIASSRGVLNVAIPALNTIALCAGYGGLEIGLAAACEHLGWEHRVAAYVEREAYAAALLACRMEAGELDAAPVWSDLTTFDAGRWRGAVDCITAGFPCQPHSHAGRRKGVEDERWIWPDIIRIVRESGAWLVVLENVAGLLSSGGFGPLLADLAALGFDVEWGVLSAGAVGAAHRRERVFIVAIMADAALSGRHQGIEQQPGRQRLAAPDQRKRAMADAGEPRREGRLFGRGDHAAGRQEPDGSAAVRGLPLFAPGPSAPEWQRVIAASPWLAPAIEPGLRVLADGAAVVVDEHRAHQLRLGGNGVVPLQAACAIVSLVRRLRIGG